MQRKRTEFNFTNLYCFYVVAREGSQKLAVPYLGKTQPAITQNVRALEKWLGYKVFERSEGDSRENSLTEVGEQVYEICITIFEAAHVLFEYVSKDYHGNEVEVAEEVEDAKEIAG